MRILARATTLSPRARRTVGLVGALPLVAAAGFQVALWRGAPYGDAVLGGRAPTVDGVLTRPYRWAALGQGGLLVAMAAVLARAGSPGPRRAVGTVAGLMALNTVANVTSPHPLERRMGAATLLAALCGAGLAAQREPGLRV